MYCMYTDLCHMVSKYVLSIHCLGIIKAPNLKSFLSKCCAAFSNIFYFVLIFGPMGITWRGEANQWRHSPTMRREYSKRGFPF